MTPAFYCSFATELLVIGLFGIFAFLAGKYLSTSQEFHAFS